MLITKSSGQCATLSDIRHTEHPSYVTASVPQTDHRGKGVYENIGTLKTRNSELDAADALQTILKYPNNDVIDLVHQIRIYVEM
jgi:hypothetical protein